MRRVLCIRSLLVRSEQKRVTEELGVLRLGECCYETSQLSSFPREFWLRKKVTKDVVNSFHGLVWHHSTHSCVRVQKCQPQVRVEIGDTLKSCL